MIERQNYLDKLLKWKDKDVIKVITGMRRCGKSTLLKQFQQILIDQGVNSKNIVFINFEELENIDLLDYKSLYSYIKKECKGFLSDLKNNIINLKSEINKIRQKYDANNDLYFSVDLNYKRAQEDSFILSYSLNQKLNTIKKLKESIHLSKDYNIFQEPKRETLINTKIAEDNLDRINEDLQKYALFEIKQFNKYYNRTQRKLKKRNLNKNKIQIFNQIINYFQQYNQGKKSNYIIQQSFLFALTST